MRSEARCEVFKYVFSTEFNGGDKQLFSTLLKNPSLSADDRDFAVRLLTAVITHRDELTDDVARLAKNYRLERVFVADKCALMLGMAEIKYIDDVPPVVSIDEAVKLVKTFSTEKSVGFVNGVLASYLKETELESI